MKPRLDRPNSFSDGSSLLEGQQIQISCQQQSGSGCLILGAEVNPGGPRKTLYSPSDYGGEYRLLPVAAFQGYQLPAPTLPLAFPRLPPQSVGTGFEPVALEPMSHGRHAHAELGCDRAVGAAGLDELLESLAG